MIFPATGIVTPQVMELINVFEKIHTRADLQSKLGLSDREHFRKSYLQPAIDAGVIALTIPEKPTSSNQRYVLTAMGARMKEK